MVRRHGGGAGLALALASAATFGTSGSFATALLGAGWSPGAAVTARIGIAGLLLLGPACYCLRGRWHTLRSGAATIALYGLLAVAGCQLFYFNAVQRLSVGVALLLEYLGPVLVVLWLWLRRRTPPGRLTLGGAALAVLGLMLVLDLFGHGALDPIGVLWGLAAAVGLAVFYLLSARDDTGLPGVVLACGGMLVGAVVLGLLGLAHALPMHAAAGDVVFAGHRVPPLVPLAGLAVVAAAFAYVAGIGAARFLGAKVASFVGLTEVLFAIGFAWLTLGQMPTLIQLGGGLLIVGGVALVRADELRAGNVAAQAEGAPAAMTDRT